MNTQIFYSGIFSSSASLHSVNPTLLGLPACQCKAELCHWTNALDGAVFHSSTTFWFWINICGKSHIKRVLFLGWHYGTTLKWLQVSHFKSAIGRENHSWDFENFIWWGIQMKGRWMRDAKRDSKESSMVPQ